MRKRRRADPAQHLDVPYIAAHAVEFPVLEHWQAVRYSGSNAGRSDHDGRDSRTRWRDRDPCCLAGAANWAVGARRDAAKAAASTTCSRMRERAQMLAARVEKLVALKRRTAQAKRKLAIVLVQLSAERRQRRARRPISRSSPRCYGTRCIRAKAAPATIRGRTCRCPDSRQRSCEGNAERFGTPTPTCMRGNRSTTTCAANRGSPRSRPSGARLPAVTKATAGASLCSGEQFGNVFVGVQPAFGYEGDPMRLLFEKGFAPTHAFRAFYRYLREDFAARRGPAFRHPRRPRIHAGQADGAVGECWPDRLIGIAKLLPLRGKQSLGRRRSPSGAGRRTLISYLTPPDRPGRSLYKGLLRPQRRLIERPLADAGRREDQTSANELLRVIQAQAIRDWILLPPGAGLDADVEAEVGQLSLDAR